VVRWWQIIYPELVKFQLDDLIGTVEVKK